MKRKPAEVIVKRSSPLMFRIEYICKAWVNKADPSEHGVRSVSSNDPSWLHEQALRLQSQGHRVTATLKWFGDQYKPI